MVHPEIERPQLQDWQDVLDLVLDICPIPAALILHQGEEDAEVILAAGKEVSLQIGQVAGGLAAVLDNPSPEGEAPEWSLCRDRGLGFDFFYGIPIRWPDGIPYGLICILDREARSISGRERRLISQSVRYMEAGLALLAARQALIEATNQDGLTKIANREYFVSRLQGEFSRARRYGQPLCLAALDIDGLKGINIERGHDVGDLALRFFASVLAESIRKGDLAARTSGGQFALLSPSVKVEQAAQFVERIRQLIEQRVGDCPVSGLSFSAGIAELGMSDKSALTLLKRADNALFTAKGRGQGQTCY
ncbi:MAG: GGDEF domain-containing protein [Gammaproteobacteria bacterium]|nr:GGDEF domain-containing protein [Gammaproteobacteria bacterium]MBU1653267.1 GGDEF domain-containing protein [Gammaproteobacteria bacterium]MBU1961493.1 GGDEF domain-containing protein [Gammaproteobacteria bacterium]